MRQIDDHEFALLLNRLREGNQTADDLKVLQSRHIDALGLSCDDVKHMPHLFCKKIDATEHNSSVLAQMNLSDLVSIDAYDTVSGDLNCNLKQYHKHLC